MHTWRVTLENGETVTVKAADVRAARSRGRLATLAARSAVRDVVLVTDARRDRVAAVKAWGAAVLSAGAL
jgi:hypothetical protein